MHMDHTKWKAGWKREDDFLVTEPGSFGEVFSWNTEDKPLPLKTEHVMLMKTYSPQS